MNFILSFSFLLVTHFLSQWEVEPFTQVVAHRAPEHLQILHLQCHFLLLMALR
jgi:hypothetical protein